MTVRVEAARKAFDIIFVGSYTKDTIVDASGTRVVDGGAFYYGANVAARLGYRTGAVTRLAKEDLYLAERLEALGVEVFPELTPQSTRLRLVYPSANPDERQILVDASAGSFRPEQVSDLRARAALIGASFRGEVSLAVLQALKQRCDRIALDVQGFVRVVRDGRLAFESWPEMAETLPLVTILKTDAVEAKVLTGRDDFRAAAAMLHELGAGEIVLTHRDGVLVLAEGRTYEASFFPRQLLGRSGRGDTCIAAYATWRLDHDAQESTFWAAAVTSLKMESPGPFRAAPREVEQLLAEKYAPQ